MFDLREGHHLLSFFGIICHAVNSTFAPHTGKYWSKIITVVTLFFVILELQEPTLKSRTDNTITVGFVKLQEDKNQLSYSVEVTGNGHQATPINCNPTTEECEVPNLVPGLLYGFKVKSCITTASGVCSIPSNEATIQTLPKGNF